jgi:multicomponent Na+:H+ antiporter subunit B
MTHRDETDTGNDTDIENDQPRTDGGEQYRDRLPDEDDQLRSAHADVYAHGTTVIARTVVRTVVPIIVVTALALLFQGHNRPGGGFIGAVLTATAAVLVYVIFGLEYLQSQLFGIDGTPNSSHAATNYYRWLFSGGLALAAGSGLAPLFFGFPFLTQGVAFVHGLPIYGELEVASALAFDLGVYAAVVGGLLTIVAEVGEE